MKDISERLETLREAVAEAYLKAGAEAIGVVKRGEGPWGGVLEMARMAGVQAAKKTPELVPYCYPVPLDWVLVDFDIREDGILIRARAKALSKTSVEMEALNAASVAATILYHRLKPIDGSVEITSIKLVEARGGEEEWVERFKAPLRAAVLVFSDAVFEGKKEDRAGSAVVSKLEGEPVEVAEYRVYPDDLDTIKGELLRLSDEEGMDLVLTTGGTGLSPTDVTVEATREVIEREVPGISEAQRIYGFQRTPYAMLSRGVAGVRGGTVIINLPGSSRGAAESMDALFPWVLHVFRVLARGGGDRKSKDKGKEG